MPGKILLLSTAYLPPVGYIASIARYSEVKIELNETYLKQSYRNRCIIAGANGLQSLSVPVLRGSFHKTPVDEVLIDYSRRWGPDHIRSLISAYSNAPYFDFYSGEFFEIISSGEPLLVNLNMKLLKLTLETLGIKTDISFTGSFVKPEISDSDLRYSISPKSNNPYRREIEFKPYPQLFSDRYGFKPDISIIDLIFNMGPESLPYLKSLY
ncbi:MAG: WbqC family protein [Bacteroidales bacterium]